MCVAGRVMTGILLIAVAMAWLVVAFFLTRRITRPLRSSFIRLATGSLAFPVLLVTPLADELIGAWQFNSLCKKYAVQVVDEQAALNAHVVSTDGSGDRDATGTAVRIRIRPWIYQDATTGKVVVSYHTLYANGGWLIRALGISETTSPLLFARSCGPANERAFVKAFHITIIN
jgi:hypothetical protein